jgi:flavorubredoxin
MLKAIDKIENLDIKMICTGHGPVLRKNWKKIVEISKKLAEEALAEPERPRVFIPYVSAYQKTGMVAQLIAEGIKQAGEIDVDVCDIEMSPMGELEEKIMHSTAYIMGSPTINQNILFPIYKCFALINPIRDKGKLAAAFGSFGWSGEAKKLITDNLANLKLKVFDEGMFVKFTPNNEESDAALAFGKAFGEELLSYNN